MATKKTPKPETALPGADSATESLPAPSVQASVLTGLRERIALRRRASIESRDLVTAEICELMDELAASLQK
jgi:hypothetical protein